MLDSLVEICYHHLFEESPPSDEELSIRVAVV